MKALTIQVLGHLISLNILSGDIKSSFREIISAKSVMTLLRAAVKSVLASDSLELKPTLTSESGDGYTYQANTAINNASRQAVIDIIKMGPTGRKSEIMRFMMDLPETIETTSEADGANWFLKTSVCHHQVVINDNGNVLRDCKEQHFKAAIACRMKLEPFLHSGKSYSANYETASGKVETVTFTIPSLYVAPECTHIAYFEVNGEFIVITSADFMVATHDKSSALAYLFSSAMNLKNALGGDDASPVSVMSIPFDLPVWEIHKAKSKKALLNIIDKVKAHQKNCI